MTNRAISPSFLRTLFNNENSLTALLSIFSILTTIILIIIRIFVSGPSNISYIDVILPLTLGLSLNSTLLCIRLWQRASLLKDSTQRIEGSINDIAEATIAQSEESKNYDQVRNYQDVMRTSCTYLLDHIYGVATSDKQKFSIDTRNLAVLIITKMWRELTEKQRRLGRERPIKVDITHSDSILFWNRGDAGSTLELQTQFIEAGGIINRIIKGNIPISRFDEMSQTDDKESTELFSYKSIIENMVGHLINVFYIMEEVSSDAYDFALIKTPQADDFAMVWHVRKNVVQECVLIARTEAGGELDDIETELARLNRIIKTSGREWIANGQRNNS